MSHQVDLRTLYGKRTALLEMDQLASIALPPVTDSYQPIGHADFAQRVKLKMSQNGITVTQEKHAVWRQGLRYFGIFQVTHESISSPEMGLMVGIRNSLDKSLPALIGAGVSVFICSNGIFAADEISLSRKHTKFLFEDLDDNIGRGVLSLMGLWQNHLARVEAYKVSDLGNAQAHDLIINAYREGVIDKTQIADVAEEWHAPRYQERKERNLWSLHNAFTEAFKGRADMIHRRSTALHRLLDAVSGFGNG